MLRVPEIPFGQILMLDSVACLFFFMLMALKVADPYR